MQFINGRPAEGSGPGQTVINPATGRVLATYPEASRQDVDVAVAAAKAAFPEWSRSAPADRAAAMLRVANILRERSREIAESETQQTGKPIRLSTEFDVPGTIDNAFDEYTAIKHVMIDITGEPKRAWHRTIFTDPTGTAQQ